MLDLWPYKVGLKERVAAIEKELRAPEAKLAIRAAIGAGRHTIVQRLSASMDLAIIEFPSFDDLDAPLHGLVQLASHAGTLDTVLDAPAGDLLQKTVAAAQALADANRAVVVLLPVPRSGNPREADAATRRRIEQMLAVLVGVPSLRLAVLATPQTRLRDGFTRTIELEESVRVLGRLSGHASPALRVEGQLLGLVRRRCNDHGHGGRERFEDSPRRPCDQPPPRSHRPETARMTPGYVGTARG